MGTTNFQCPEAERIDKLFLHIEDKRDQAAKILADLETAKRTTDRAAETMLSLDAGSVDAYLQVNDERDRLQAIVDGMQNALDLRDTHVSEIPSEVYNLALDQHYSEFDQLFEQGFTQRIAALEELLVPARKGFGDFVSTLLQRGTDINEAKRLAASDPHGQFPQIVQNSITAARGVITDIRGRREKPARRHLLMLIAELPSKPSSAA